MDYKRKIDSAIKLLRNIPQDGPIEVSYSGGKDSDIILELAKMAGIPFEAIYKNTTIDPPGTIKHCKDNGVTIIQPKQTFFQLVDMYGTPGRFRRFCCSILKEYKVYDRAVQGIRREESTKRAMNYKEPETCRKYKSGGKSRVYLPILEWTLDDVARFIEERQIKLAPAYYDADGTCHYERRLGCIGCPLASEWKRREQFKQYPKMLRLWIRNANSYYQRNPENLRELFGGDIYQKFYADLFFPNYQKYLDRRQDINAREALEEYFNTDLSL